MASNANVQGYGSDPASPHTTFVQADPSNFRAIVQKLTGAPEDPSAHKLPLTLPSRLTPKPPPAAAPATSISDVGLRRPTFKLHERRQRKLDMIQLNHKNVGFYADKHGLTSPPHPPSSSLSPTWLRQYGKRGGLVGFGGGGGGGGGEAGPPGVCINDVLTDDELRSVLARLESEKDREIFGLVCKRWLALQSAERRRLAARAGPHMLAMLAARFGRVVELDLSQSVSRSFYPGVTDADLAVVARKFKRLKVLNLSHCKGITDKGMLEIGDGLSTLQSLDVSFCRKLTDRGLEAVARGCHDMRTLHLASCRAVSDVLLLGLSRNCPNLEELVLEGCTNITDHGITDLVGGCQKIKLLDVSKCSNVGDVGISNVAKSCSSSLRTLKLLDCCKVGDQSVLSLASFCMGLETLVVSGCRDISDESLKSLAAACGNSLKTLGMNWCLNVSDLSLSSILAQCRYLEALDIGCCEEVTDAAFQGLASVEDVLSLKFLKISNCPNITVTGLGIILDKCRSLEYLDLRSCPHISKTACDEAMLRFPDCCKVNYVGRLSEPDMKL